MTAKIETNSIFVSGTGKMGRPLMLGIDQDPRYKLLPWAISLDIGSFIQVGKEEIGLIPLEERTYMLPNIWNDRGPFILVDAVPAVDSQPNAELYSQFDSLPVIMMSTGIKDLSKIRNTLVLPNACIQLIAWEKFISEQNENMFAGGEYSLKVVESHQASKIDVSGTALKMTPKFRRLGIQFDDNDIDSLRKEKDYSRIAIPMDFWGSHGHHKYTLISKKKTDDLLISFFQEAESFLKENKLFKSLFCKGSDSENMKTYYESVCWVNTNLTTDKTFKFGINLVLNGDGTQVSIFHTILGHDPYVHGVLNNALPFMQQKCRNGLTGENFTSLDLYDWAMNR